MNNPVFYLFGDTKVQESAKNYLAERGYSVVSHPSASVTHLILSVPSFDPSGQLKGGSSIKDIFALLPENITVIGGNLPDEVTQGRPCIDLLHDPQYLAQNAAITADCAIRIAGNNLPVVFDGCPILIIGWGRIGKCLAQKLKNMGADVTVAARKEQDRSTALSLGFLTRDTARLDFGLSHYRVIFNTAPVPVLADTKVSNCRSDCILIDLASRQGILGDNVIWARGLPGRDTPESSGHLIAKTVLRLTQRKENPI